VFGPLQDALNTVWGVKAKPGGGIWAFFAQPLLFFRDGRRGLFPSVGLPNNRERAQGVQSLYQSVMPGGIVIAIREISARKVANRRQRSAIAPAETAVMQPI
jgi:hypothetical protein